MSGKTPRAVGFNSSPSLHNLRLLVLTSSSSRFTAAGFNPFLFLESNPLYGLLALGVLITLGAPKLMERLDPEGYAEVSAQSASSQQMISSLQNADLSGSLSKYLAGGAGAAPAPPAGAGEAGTTIASAPGTLAGGEKVTGGSSGVAVGAGGTPGKKGGKKRR